MGEFDANPALPNTALSVSNISGFWVGILSLTFWVMGVFDDGRAHILVFFFGQNIIPRWGQWMEWNDAGWTSINHAVGQSINQSIGWAFVMCRLGGFFFACGGGYKVVRYQELGNIPMYH